MKKLFTTILSFTLISSALMGCSKPAADTTQAKQADSKEVKLNLMVTTRPTTNNKDLYLDYVPELIKEKYPNITITVDQLPTAQYTSTIKMKLASGQAPDLFTWWPDMQAKPLVEANYVKDLSSFSKIGNFNKDMVKSYSFGEKVYGIPLGMSFLTTFYNKDLFKKANIDKVPESWDEFMEDCEKLKSKGITPIVTGDKDAFVIQFGLYQLAASPVYADNMEFDKKLVAGEKKFTDPAWIESIKKFQDLYKKGYVLDGSLGMSQDQARQLFIDGKAAMRFDGSFGYTAMTAKGAADFERGMFPLPGNDKGKKQVVNLTPGNGLFVSAASKEQDSIQKVLDYWFTEGTPLFQKWCELNDNIPSYNGVKEPRPLIQDYLEKYTKTFPTIYNLNNAWPTGVSDEMCSRFQDLIANKGTPEDVANAMQAKLDQLLKK